MSDGEPKIEVHLEWQMTPKTEPQWDVQGCYITTIDGDPMIINRHMIFPATGTPHSLMDAGLLRLVGHDDHRDARAQRDAFGVRGASPV